MADAPGDPTEGVGVWASGLFGSGKSSFAKNLGYILANREILGHPAVQLFIRQLQAQAPNDPAVARIADTINFINQRFPAQVIMFDVQMDRAVRRSTEPMAEIMYTVLLRELHYALDYDVAELEIELEGEGRLGEFVRAVARMYGDQVGAVTPGDALPPTLQDVSPEEYAVWQKARKGAQKTQQASAALHEIDPRTYPTPDSWAASLQEEADITIRTLVGRTFELATRRRPGHAVIYIIDEVRAYVARSAEKIENLRAVVEHFGQESKNRVLSGKAVAPVWVIVTSQEKLDEVVAAIDDKRVELAKLQDRFKIRIDMAPADIREVATRRVLAKKPAAEPLLRERFDSAAAMLKTHTRLERTTRRFDVGREEFVQFYPYLPHFIDLSTDIVSGIRLQPGAPKHIGGSNRTIIKQAYEMLVSNRTALAKAPVGAAGRCRAGRGLAQPARHDRELSPLGRPRADRDRPGCAAARPGAAHPQRDLCRRRGPVAGCGRVGPRLPGAGDPSRTIGQGDRLPGRTGRHRMPARTGRGSAPRVLVDSPPGDQDAVGGYRRRRPGADRGCPGRERPQRQVVDGHGPLLAIRVRGRAVVRARHGPASPGARLPPLRARSPAARVADQAGRAGPPALRGGGE